MNFEAIAQTVGANLVRAYMITSLITAAVVAIYGIAKITKILLQKRKGEKTDE